MKTLTLEVKGISEHPKVSAKNFCLDDDETFDLEFDELEFIWQVSVARYSDPEELHKSLRDMVLLIDQGQWEHDVFVRQWERVVEKVDWVAIQELMSEDEDEIFVEVAMKVN